MKLIAYGKARVVDTNQTIYLRDEFDLYNLIDTEWEKIFKARNPTLAYIETVIDFHDHNCRYNGEDLVFDPSLHHIKQLMAFLKKNKHLKMKVR